MNNYRAFATTILIFTTALGFFVFNGTSITNDSESTERFPFKFGLDLVGGSHLVYEADVSEITEGEVTESMRALRSVLERRLNPVGVSEASVVTETPSVFAVNNETTQRVIIELPGIQDAEEAKSLIGAIPLLEFKLAQSQEVVSALITQAQAGNELTNEQAFSTISEENLYETTGLTGRFVENATLSSNQYTNETTVLLNFNTEGKEMFAEITKNNIGRVLAIFLDGVVISSPVIRGEIFNGTAEISGQFALEEAQELVRNLNYGALPVPIELVSTQSISATLGQDVLVSGIKAALLGFIAISLFLVFFYRIAGAIAVVALSSYMIVILSIFKITGVVFTAASIAGFIISIGMAVDANILIFERIKEELGMGKKVSAAITDGFARAWLSIRDSNISSILTALILFYLTTTLVRGFALTFGIGVLISMLTAITISRTLLLAVAHDNKTFRKHLLGKVTVNNK